MDGKALHLVPFPQTSIVRLTGLQSLSLDTVPSTQQLQDLRHDILEYKKQHEQRLKHCEDRLSIVDAMKDRDRNKGKPPKKEPPDGLGQPPRLQKSVQPAIRVSGPSTSSTPTQPVITPSATTTAKSVARAGSAALRTEGSVSKPNKKKRRRVEDMDDYQNDGTTRMATPISKGHGHKEHKSKKAKHDEHDLRMNPPGFRRITDWSDSLRGGLPPKPPRNPLPAPQTDDPGEVHDDMSDRKQPPNQVTAHTFWNFIEPWTRQIKDEDIAFLAFNGEDDEVWEMPPLERHYSEAWEELDRYALDLPPINKPLGTRTNNPYSVFTDPPPPSAGGALQPAVNSGVRWDPATLSDLDAVTEQHGSGPITERIFSSFMHIPTSARTEEEDGPKGGPGMGRGVGQGTVGDLEERLMKECKALGLIAEGEEPDYSQPQDDQVASELRRCQRALRQQIQINEARKKRLLSISELRMSFADYEDVKEGMERHISNLFARLGNTGAPKATKKKKKEKEKIAASAAVNSSTGEPAGISGLGLVGMDGNLQIPNEILEPVRVLRRWKADIGEKFEQIERENPGLIRGLPTKSIYEGLEEEIAGSQVVVVSQDGAPSNGETLALPSARQDSPEDIVMQPAD
ncbi:Transcriptional regulator [Serendipita sp. 411]|nr:Transcriptional regulator [Serendipita sp. 400]KAG8851581.1 Transcriptional regulator [Serendipita sp. 411]